MPPQTSWKTFCISITCWLRLQLWYLSMTWIQAQIFLEEIFSGTHGHTKARVYACWHFKTLTVFQSLVRDDHLVIVKTSYFTPNAGQHEIKSHNQRMNMEPKHVIFQRIVRRDKRPLYKITSVQLRIISPLSVMGQGWKYYLTLL